ncbi:MCE family protein [Mycobacterium conspicuum]|jgi:phospholipid/cholesterol/gamma-HCH transport system substrate-binding protein|uniref:Mammalian cell entry protein n=1 Tax=Mycobacterium conspicuum TaxID=44010 RepID=A0A1X1TQU6_9MYCO|nr:MCE family protein [Mycobacterium conspicuum]ORV46829.1 mammalian cell entry protein [Mycobacterium conspicuum]BBZ40248.1 mammalian cell entry protein [Mycobacterium conspicuum]
MLRYRDAKHIRSGFIGAVLIVLVTAVGLAPERLLAWATTIHYQALFSEAGGLAAGNNVLVSGVKVGTVSDVSLRDGDALVTFGVSSKVRLGSLTSAHIRTGSLLGARVLTLEPTGSGRMRASDVIPMTRTSSPYSLSAAVSELTTNLASTSTDSLNHSLDALSATIDQIAPQLSPTFEGLTKLSRAINNRGETLDALLKSASDLTGILSGHNQQVNSLILDGNALLDVLVQRRNAIGDLLANVSAVAKELSGLVADNESKLAPTLDRLNSVAAVLEKNRDNLSKALPGLKKYEFTSGEAVANGFYYNAFVPNLAIPELIQPFFDYYFGFRRHDPHLPRALFPWPHNGIPQGIPGPHDD